MNDSGKRRDWTEVALATGELIPDGTNERQGAGTGRAMASMRIDGPLDPRMRQQEVLAQLGSWALRRTDPDTLLREAARLVALGLRTGYCGILEYLPAEHRFLPRAWVGWPDGAARPGSLAAAAVASADKAMREAGPVASNSFAGNGREPLSRLPRLHGIVRALDVAISRSDSVFGVLAAGSDTPGEFGAMDVGFIQAAANLIGMALDRARAEAALVASWTRTQEILESISDITFTLDHAFRFTHLNGKAVEWSGRAREDLLGQVIWDAFPRMVGTEMQAACHRAARERRVVHLETIGVVRRRWVEISIYPSEDGLAVYFRDIDERKHADAALRESEVRLRFAVESAGIGTWEQDIATGRVTRSPGHAAIFGVDPSVPWSHATFLRHVLREDRARADAQRRKALAGGTDWRIICRIRRANDGAVRWIEARGAPMPEPSGELLRYVGIISDITERMEAESSHQRQAETLERRVAERTRELAEANARLTREIAERERAESALLQAQRLEAIGQLVGGVAHAFTNLLTATISNLELAGRGKLDANSVLSGLSEVLARTCGERVRIATRNVGAGDAALPADLPAGDYILLSVADEGVGMPPDVLARAAEPFFTTKIVGQGHGLGLAQVDGVARQFGGTMRVRSAVGQGTTVDIFLPRAVESDAGAARDAGPVLAAVAL